MVKLPNQGLFLFPWSRVSLTFFLNSGFAPDTAIFTSAPFATVFPVVEKNFGAENSTSFTESAESATPGRKWFSNQFFTSTSPGFLFSRKKNFHEKVEILRE